MPTQADLASGVPSLPGLDVRRRTRLSVGEFLRPYDPGFVQMSLVQPRAGTSTAACRTAMRIVTGTVSRHRPNVAGSTRGVASPRATAGPIDLPACA